MKPTSTEHLILFRNTCNESRLSPADLQRALDETMAWFERLHAEGKVKAAQPLFEEGRRIAGPGGKDVTDGPFAESKEAIGGYLVLPECSADEALEIARSWPMLAHGALIELRPIAPECPTSMRLREQRSHATA